MWRKEAYKKYKFYDGWKKTRTLYWERFDGLKIDGFKEKKYQTVKNMGLVPEMVRSVLKYIYFF